MCGLVAVYGAAAASAALRPALDALRHRGPDGEGVARSSDGRCVLGHRRLALVDVAGGAQPLRTEDGSITLVVNGELYDDGDALRSALSADGAVFRTHSDAELLLHAYAQRGIGSLASLRGEFAFVLYDAREGKLVAGRDRFGVKPLVYATQGDALYVASEAKALFALGVTAKLSREALRQALWLQYVAPNETLFEGVAQVPPGCVLVADARGARVSRYVEDPLSEREGAHDDALVHSLRAALDRSVRLRLRGDVSCAFYLSGGLDSATVLSAAARHSDRALDAFTLQFDDPKYDESAAAEEVAAHVGARVHRVSVSRREMVERVSEAVFYSEGPTINGHLVAKFLLSKAVRDAGYKVALVGEGADELFAGYSHLRADAIAHGVIEAQALHEGDAVSVATMLAIKGSGADPWLSAVKSAIGCVPDFLAAKLAMGRRTTALVEREVAGDENPLERMLRSFDAAALRATHPVRASMHLWSKLALANYILRTLGDGTEMAHSVEGRTPFLDGEVQALAARMPVSMLLRGGVEKWPLREAARPWLHPAVVERRKHPLLAPPLTADEGAHAALQDALRGDGAPSFADRAALRSALDALAGASHEERQRAEPALLTLYSLAAMERAFSVT